MLQNVVETHFLPVHCFVIILYTIIKLFSSALQGYMIHMCLLKLRLQNKWSSSQFCISLHYATVHKLRPIFYLWNGLLTYYTPLESSFQVLYKGVWFNCIFCNCTWQINNHAGFFLPHELFQNGLVRWYEKALLCSKLMILSVSTPIQNYFQALYKGL